MAVSIADIRGSVCRFTDSCFVLESPIRNYHIAADIITEIERSDGRRSEQG
jgi:hypothetical protein